MGSDTTWGAFSPVWSFTTGTSTEPPGPPTLDSPEDGAVLGPVTSVMLAWIPPAGGAVSYTVEVAQDSVFTQGVLSYPGVEGESLQVTNLTEDQWYWWRVQSCDGGQACSSWSDPVHRFYTGSLAVQRYYYVKDHLGSVRATVDEGGAVVHYDDYYPFGMPMPGRSLETPEAPRERYTGHEVEVDIDPDYKAVYYAGARYYDGLIGRWDTVDPKDYLFPDQSPYNYVFNNPVNLTDPDGACPPCLWAAAAGLVFLGEALLNPKTANAPGPGDPKTSDFQSVDEFVADLENTSPGEAAIIVGGAIVEKGVERVAGKPAGEVVEEVTDQARQIVRRFDTTKNIKRARKEGITFDPEKGSGIPTTTTNIDPVDPDAIREITGARSAESYIDIDITGKKTLQRRTKSGNIEIVVQEDIKPADIVGHGRVRRSKRSPENQ